MHYSFVRRTGILCVAVAALLCEDGCSSNPSGRSAPAPADPGSSRSVITAAQITEGRYTNAFEAVEALRSNWLHKRGNDSINNPSEIQVYLDNVRLGEVDTLRGIQSNAIISIRFIPAVEATSRWGLGHASGVIFVSTRN